MGRPDNLSVGNNLNRTSACTNRCLNSNEMFRIIEIVDSLGNIYRRKVFGRMATTEHNKISSILDRRACCGCYRNRKRSNQVLTRQGHQAFSRLIGGKERERESGASDGGNGGKGSQG